MEGRNTAINYNLKNEQQKNENVSDDKWNQKCNISL